jgi:hypothetical protein
MMKIECRIPTRSFPLPTKLNFCYFSRFMSSPEELAREKIDIKHLQWSSRGRCDMDHRPEGFMSRRASDQSAQLDRVSRVCISPIQRLYSMLRFLFFWGRNTDAARRDPREETCSSLCAFNHASRRIAR